MTAIRRTGLPTAVTLLALLLPASAYAQAENSEAAENADEAAENADEAAENADEAAENADTTEPAEPARRTYRVGYTGNPPFIVETSDAELDGISAEIWAATAARLGIEYELHAYPSASAAVEAVAADEIDVAIGPISITSERARSVVFTQPYWQADLAIMAPLASGSAWDRVSPFVSTAFMYGVATLLIVLAAVGTFLWFTERVDNDAFPRDPVSGIGEGIWLALVTMTTVGYGDRVPITRWGRIVTGIWMIISMVTASSLTAGIATALTLTALEKARIESAEQLRGLSVVTVEGTTAEEFARRHGARVLHVDNAESAADAVVSGRADAAVFDRPVLQYVLRQRPELELRLGEPSYEPQHYGFAFQLDDAMRHRASIALLELSESGRIEAIATGWR